MVFSSSWYLRTSPPLFFPRLQSTFKNLPKFLLKTLVPSSPSKPLMGPSCPNQISNCWLLTTQLPLRMAMNAYLFLVPSQTALWVTLQSQPTCLHPPTYCGRTRSLQNFLASLAKNVHPRSPQLGHSPAYPMAGPEQANPLQFVGSLSSSSLLSLLLTS